MGKISFQSIQIKYIDLFKQYIDKQSFNCDWSIANIFCWQHYYRVEWAFVLDHIVIRFRIDGGTAIGYMISSLEDSPEVRQLFPLLMEDAAALGQPFRISSLTERDRDLMNKILPNSLFFDNNRDNNDYLYKMDDFRHLKGAKYAAKRNHINRFASLYKFEYKPLTKDCVEDCLKLEMDWKEMHLAYPNETEAELETIRFALSNFEVLSLIGGTLYVNNELVAFTYGSAIKEDTFCVHIEKANIDYEGVFAMINYQFVNHLPKKFTFINRENDLGLPGLRKSKLSYHPLFMEEKYSGLLLDDTSRSIIDIWSTCFHDEENFIKTFLIRYYSPEISLFKKIDHRIVSMLFMVPFYNELGYCAYIYGVATLPQYQHQGYAGEMVRNAIEQCKNEHFEYMMLIPGSEELKNYYTQFGFMNTEIPIVFNSDFDFGTGNPQNDKVMILTLTDKSVDLPSIINC